MINQIQKLRPGGKAEKEAYAEKQAAFETAYAAATPEQRQQVDAYMQSARNYSSANPMYNRNARKYASDVYDIATKILNGEQVPSSGTPIGQIGNAYNVYSDFVNKNKNRTTQATAATTIPSGESYYRYKWSNGLDTDWLSDSDTLEQRMSSFAQTLKDNLLAAKNSGKTLLGIDDTAISNALALLNKETWTKDDMKTLRRAAQYAKVDASAFKSYFGDLMPKISEQDKVKRTLLNEGYTENNNSYGTWGNKTLQDLGYHILTKDGKNYAFDKDWNKVNKLTKINLGQDGYGQAFIVDDNGVFTFTNGDLKQGDYGYDQYNAYVKELKYKYSPLYQTYDFNIQNDYTNSDLMKSVIDKVAKANPNATQASFADVSGLFEGNLPVIASTSNGAAVKIGKFGEIDLNDPNLEFTYKDSNGKIQTVKGLDNAIKNIGNYSPEGYGESEQQAGNYQNDIMQIFANAQGLSLDEALNKWSWKNLGLSAGAGGLAGAGFGGAVGAAVGAGLGAGAYALGRLFRNDSIKDNPKKFVDLVIQAYENGNEKIDIPGIDMTGTEFLTSIGEGNQKAILETVGKLVYDGIVKLSPEEKVKFDKLIRDVYATKYYFTKQDKNGGDINIDYMAELIQSAKKGASILDSNQEDKKSNVTNWHQKYIDNVQNLQDKVDAAKEEGKTVKQYEGDKSTKLNASDYLRFATIAQDAGSLAASFAPGAGTAAAGALGITSLFTDLAADAIDDSVSAKDLARNALFNTGFAALGLIPGGKLPKITKNIIKYAPKALAVISGTSLAADESVRNTFSKIGKEKLNHEDWKNITRVFQLAAGIGRGAKQDIANVRAKVKYKGDITNSKTLTKGSAKATLDDSKVELLNKHLQNGEKDKAIAILTKAGFSEDEAQIAIRNAHKWEKGKLKLDGVKINETKDMSSVNKRMQADWDEEAAKINNPSWRVRLAAKVPNNPLLTAKQRALLNMGFTPSEQIGPTTVIPIAQSARIKKVENDGQLLIPFNKNGKSINYKKLRK